MEHERHSTQCFLPAGLAQLEEHFSCKEDAIGSSPISGSMGFIQELWTALQNDPEAMEGFGYLIVFGGIGIFALVRWMYEGVSDMMRRRRGAKYWRNNGL